MAFTVEQIKNLALMELNHETISDWTDSTNTDIEIINTQYALAKPVALSMYQWSWAFRYAVLPTYEYVVTFPTDRIANSAFTIYTDSTMTEQITDFVTDDITIYLNATSIYLDYMATGDVPTQVALTSTAVSENISKYKKATLLPDDFIGYLSAYTDGNLRILGNYLNVGRDLFTNSDKLYIKYIANVDESIFTPEFIDWFKMFLAQRLNGYLNGDMQRQALLTQEEPFFFRKAKNIDSKRNKHESLDGNPLLWIRGKLGGGV